MIASPSLKRRIGGSRLTRILNDSLYRTPMTASGRVLPVGRIAIGSQVSFVGGVSVYMLLKRCRQVSNVVRIGSAR